ncbi:ABC transporter [Streptomyces sp. NPDC059740]|uniref:ABC transporter n=1 Tax=Streptomyces sp. NPDC059740 TaxID=3346926 RepID=UPI0036655DFC
MMTALLRYQGALLLRSRRWLPPVLVLVAFLAIGVQTGGPVLDGFGYAAAGLLPVTAWLVRVCVTAEPQAARDCTGAATGPHRVHLAWVLTAGGFAAVLALCATLFVAVSADPRSTDHRVAVPLWPAAGAGFVAALACVLLGLAAGVLTSRPVLRRRGWDVLLGTLAALLLLVVGASPANAAVTGLVAGSTTGQVTVAWWPVVAAALLATAATAAACLVSRRRT